LEDFRQQAEAFLASQEQREVPLDPQRGARIRDLRIALHETQPRMADKLGVSLRGYQAYEQGKGVSWEKVEKLGDLAGVSPEWIMRGDDGTGENGRAPDEVLAGLGEKTLGRIERGERELRTRDAREIAEACGVPVEFFTADREQLGPGSPAASLEAIERVEAKLDRLLQGDGITLAMELVPGGRRKTDPPAERKRRKAS
jgi:transcriptional regulator with XRE-family HTH domain